MFERIVQGHAGRSYTNPPPPPCVGVVVRLQGSCVHSRALGLLRQSRPQTRFGVVDLCPSSPLRCRLKLWVLPGPSLLCHPPHLDRLGTVSAGRFVYETGLVVVDPLGCESLCGLSAVACEPRPDVNTETSL